MTTIKPELKIISLQEQYVTEFRTCSPFSMQDANGQMIDIIASFSPKPFWLSILIKTGFVGWSISLLIQGLVISNPTLFWFAHFPNWSLTLSTIYFICSWLLSVCPSKTSSFDQLHLLVKFTWALYGIVAPAEIVVAILYWTLEMDPTTDTFTYQCIMVHGGGILILLLIEGLIINKIPVRISQQWFFVAYTLLFLLWTFVHAYSRMVDPTSEEDNEDTLYINLDWKNTPIRTALIAAIAILIVTPFSFVVIWLLSLYSFPFNFDGSNRRYSSPNDNIDGTVDCDTEELKVIDTV